MPTVQHPEDAVIYEAHIRDFSILDESVSEAHRGKYMAFTEKDSVPMQHLAQLTQAGLTHFHMLPANDIATVNEDLTQRIDLHDTLKDLCDKADVIQVCSGKTPDEPLLSIMQNYPPATEDAQALVEAMRRLDGFNWGYDPHHFAAPEGSYSTNPDGVTRIKEMRAMNQALHELGLRVVLDVVYNHTSDAGLADNSVLDKVVPGYYQRLNEITGEIERSTCCDNTATEHVMMDKLMRDSLVLFTEQYKFDGFRFDLMGHIPKDAILRSREAVLAVDSDNYFYGEGWDFGEVAGNRRIEQASQLNMAATEVGTFSDRQRDAVRDGGLFNKEVNLTDMDTIRVGMAGNIGTLMFTDQTGNDVSMYDHQWRGQAAGYSSDPADTVNYVSKHDNETLWDKLQYSLDADISLEDKVRAHVVSTAIPLLSQGLPFLHMGAEQIRSKSMDRNTYDSGDWFNRVDFTRETNNWRIGLPLAQDNNQKWTEISEIFSRENNRFNKSDREHTYAMFLEYLAIRTSSPLFRLTSASQVESVIRFLNTGPDQLPGLVVMQLSDLDETQIDPNYSHIWVAINGQPETREFAVAEAAGARLHPIQQASADPVIQRATVNDGSFVVPPRSAVVFVK